MKELKEAAIKQKKDNEKYVIDKSLKIDEDNNKILKEMKTDRKELPRIV